MTHTTVWHRRTREMFLGSWHVYRKQRYWKQCRQIILLHSEAPSTCPHLHKTLCEGATLPDFMWMQHGIFSSLFCMCTCVQLSPTLGGADTKTCSPLYGHWADREQSRETESGSKAHILRAAAGWGQQFHHPNCETQKHLEHAKIGQQYNTAHLVGHKWWLSRITFLCVLHRKLVCSVTVYSPVH